MNKALMISMQPQHAVNILNGKKTLELRTFIPKNYKGWVYVYVTKGKPYIYWTNQDDKTKYYLSNETYSDRLNGKVVFRFWFGEYEDIKEHWSGDEWVIMKLDELCLADDEVREYLINKLGYAWHIKQLEIFDTPKELSEFQNFVPKVDDTPEWAITSSWQIFHRPLEKAPQKMQWVYAKELENE